VARKQVAKSAGKLLRARKNEPSVERISENVREELAESTETISVLDVAITPYRLANRSPGDIAIRFRIMRE